MRDIPTIVFLFFKQLGKFLVDISTACSDLF